MSKQKKDSKREPSGEEQNVPATNIRDALKQYSIRFNVIPDKQVPPMAEGKLSPKRPFWVLDTPIPQIFFHDDKCKRVFMARIPWDKLRNVAISLHGIIDYPSIVLNLLPDEILTDAEKKHKYDRNLQRRDKKKKP